MSADLLDITAIRGHFTSPARHPSSRCQEVSTVLTAISCPDCGVPAEIIDRFPLPSTTGPVEHIVVRCAARHLFRMPVDLLPPQAQEQLARQDLQPAAARSR